MMKEITWEAMHMTGNDAVRGEVAALLERRWETARSWLRRAACASVVAGVVAGAFFGLDAKVLHDEKVRQNIGSMGDRVGLYLKVAAAVVVSGMLAAAAVAIWMSARLARNGAKARIGWLIVAMTAAALELLPCAWAMPGLVQSCWEAWMDPRRGIVGGNMDPAYRGISLAMWTANVLTLGSLCASLAMAWVAFGRWLWIRRRLQRHAAWRGFPVEVKER